MSDAAALRAKRRRERILLNSEDRMKKIFGGDNYHENHLTITEREDNNPEDQSAVNFQTCSKKLPESDASAAPPKVSQSVPAEQGNPQVFDSLMFWLTFGGLIRLVDAANYSWAFASWALLPFLLVFCSVEMLFHSRSSPAPSGLMDIAAQLAGIDSTKVVIFKRVFRIVMNFINTFCSYFIGLIIMEVISQLFF